MLAFVLACINYGLQERDATRLKVTVVTLGSSRSRTQPYPRPLPISDTSGSFFPNTCRCKRPLSFPAVSQLVPAEITIIAVLI